MMPPLITVGSSPASSRNAPIIEVGVVLPWVPAMAIDHLSRISSPSISARRTTGISRARAEMLGELMRLKWSIAVAGTHGKTTTTSMIGAFLDEAGLDPTVINGGIINAYGTNARLGGGDWMVVEADESDGTFTKLHAAIA